MPKKLWEHPNPDSTCMAQFIRDVNRRKGMQLKASSIPYSMIKQASLVESTNTLLGFRRLISMVHLDQ